MSSTAHVTEGALARPMGATAANTWDTCNCSSSSPALGCGHVASHWAYALSLSAVFGDGAVDLLDDIEADVGGEDGGDCDSVGDLVGVRVHEYVCDGAPSHPSL